MKYIVFTFVVIMCTVFIFAPKIKTLLNSNKEGEAENKILSKGQYTIGEDIRSGIYDLEVLDGNVNMIGKKLSQGDKLLGIDFPPEGEMELKGDGRVKISPAAFLDIEKNSSGAYIFEYSGYYKVGFQIPEGEYVLSYKSAKEENEPFVQITSLEGDVLESFDFNSKNEYAISLKRDSILEVHKSLFEEYDDMTVTLHANS